MILAYCDDGAIRKWKVFAETIVGSPQILIDICFVKEIQEGMEVGEGEVRHSDSRVCYFFIVDSSTHQMPGLLEELNEIYRFVATRHSLHNREG